MTDVRISPAAEAALADILEHSIEKWGLAQAERYKDLLIERLYSLARGELPHPRPCEILLRSKRSARGLCYIREGSHFIILRESAMQIDVVDFVHQSRDLERLIATLAGKPER